MKLSSYLDSSLIFTDIEAESKEEAIEKIISRMASNDEHIYKIKEMAKEGLLKREREITTAMGSGLAIPHARLAGLDDVVIGIGILKNSITCKLVSNEDDDLKILFVIIAGQTKNKLILKTMSAIIKLSMTDEILEKVIKEKNSEKIVSLIKKSKIEVSERITAKDIMNEDIKPVKLSDDLEEVAKRLTIENITGLPVVDEFGKFRGEITERELIQFGMPKYTSIMNNLSFMTVGEPFEEYFKNEHSVKVEELYRKNSLIIDQKASIMEVSFLMVTKGNTRLYVVENGKYYGMIARSDIIKKVLHI